MAWSSSASRPFVHLEAIGNTVIFSQDDSATCTLGGFTTLLLHSAVHSEDIPFSEKPIETVSTGTWLSV